MWLVAKLTNAHRKEFLQIEFFEKTYNFQPLFTK